MSGTDVLVLEPAGQTQSNVCKALRGLDLHTHVIYTFDDALACAHAEPVAAVIADIDALTEHSRVTLSEAIRRLREAQGEHMAFARDQGHSIVIVTSPSDDLAAHLDAMRAGADVYLSAAAAATPEIVWAHLARGVGRLDVKSGIIARDVKREKFVAPRHPTDLFEIHDEHLRSATSGRWDAKRIADAMGIELKQLAESMDVGYTTIHKTPDSESLQGRLEPFANVLTMAHQTYAGDAERVRKWLRKSQAQLGGKTPLDGLLMPGKAAGVEAFVTNAWLGDPG